MNEYSQVSSSKTRINVSLPPVCNNGEDITLQCQHTSPSNRPVYKQVGQTHPDDKGRAFTEARRLSAARTIARTWLRYRDRQMFQLLKHAVCAAENSLTYEILRKVSPKEAEFFKDPSCNIKVRFRFGGYEFPPEILFKVYVHSGSSQIKYISGKNVLKSHTEAAREACDMMGAKKFYDIMIQDSVNQQNHKISDHIDVITSKDYMQFVSVQDETPAYLGGKENHWRRLTMENLPRTTIFYDLLEFVYSKPRHVTSHLRRELPVLLTPPVSQDIQRQHVRIISQMRQPLVSMETSPSLVAKSRVHTDLIPVPGRTTSRRSRQAQQRTERMRRIYQDEGKLQQTSPPADHAAHGATSRVIRATLNSEATLEEYGGRDDWDDAEAENLYQWSQTLPADDVITPRGLPTIMSGVS